MPTARVGKLLRTLRKSSTLTSIAKLLGVQVQYVSDVERGRKSVSSDRLREWAQALGLRQDQIRDLFIKAKALPPLVCKRALRAPQTWCYDPGLMADALQEIRDHSDAAKDPVHAVASRGLTRVNL